MSSSRVFVSLAVSLDGYVASSTGDMQWLHDAMRPGEDYGFGEKTARTGAYILGANTFRETAGMRGSSTSTPTFVLTHDAPDAAPRGVEFGAGPPAELVARAKAATDKDVWVFGGGDVVTQMLASDLVDELELAVVPVVLGDGVPLFRPLPTAVRLRLTECRSFPSGIVLLRYEREPAEDVTAR
jgi:dihydrofolate reductase